MRAFICSIVLSFFMFFPVRGKSELVSGEKKNISDQLQIAEQITLLTEYVSKQKISELRQLWSKDFPETLIKEIENELVGRKITYNLSANRFEELSDGKIRVEGSFVVEEPGSRTSAPGTFFIFVKEGERWKILDTNFHKFEFPRWIFKVAIIFGLLGAVMFIFWIWMLVDCTRREFPVNDQTTWFTVLLLGNFVGAIIYYFKFKRKVPR